MDGKLWKTKTFSTVSVIDGVPTPLLIKMHDLIVDQSTEIAMCRVEYDLSVPDEIFDSKKLQQVASYEC